MLPVEQNELISQIGTGTPAGELLRRYWMPALLSRELPDPDGPPVRVKLLGEELIAFRDTQGRVGLIEEFCPHRRVSLWYGRNEESGLRCIYHGWKFDIEGTCVEQMNEPESFAHKVHIVSYPTTEMGDMVWAYMGPKELMPPPPNFEWVRAPASHRHVSKVWQECNWVQGLEGGIDTSHAPILHRALAVNGAGSSPHSPFVRGKPPTIELDTTDYGYRYFGVRELDESEYYIRGYHYVMPFHQIRPAITNNRGGGFEDDTGPIPLNQGHIWVPADDHNTVVYNWMLSVTDAPLTEDHRLEKANGNGADHVNQQTWRSYDGKWNEYGIDRQRQKSVNFSGIDGVNKQDRAVQESMGRVVDRSREQLGPADRAIITMRQLLLEAVRTVKEGGDPPGAGDSYYNIRAWEKILPRTPQWRDEMLPAMYPTGGQRELAAVH
ncbi:MAG TPA: Rieske 2Fe-2S domain-containing protein [Dehalococcoidia bacterium]|nr:Rieske 2Fe-2S domain-containing protein [Dehalococcoidia bacterium]